MLRLPTLSGILLSPALLQGDLPYGSNFLIKTFQVQITSLQTLDQFPYCILQRMAPCPRTDVRQGHCKTRHRPQDKCLVNEKRVSIYSFLSQLDLTSYVTSVWIDLTFYPKGTVQSDFMSLWSFEVHGLWICSWSYCHQMLSLSLLYSSFYDFKMLITLVMYFSWVFWAQSLFYHLRYIWV